jgi:hypothetical protein
VKDKNCKHTVKAKVWIVVLQLDCCSPTGLLFSNWIVVLQQHLPEHLVFERVETVFADITLGLSPLECFRIYGTTNKTCKFRHASSVIKQGRAAAQQFISSYSPVGGIVKDSSTRSTMGLKMDYASN